VAAVAIRQHLLIFTES